MSAYVVKHMPGSSVWAVGKPRGGWLAQGMSERTARKVARLLNAEEVGVNYCVVHEGIANEDHSGACDFADDSDEECRYVSCFILRPPRRNARPQEAPDVP